MKKTIVFLGILALAIAAFFTCPPSEAHQEAVKKEVSEAVSDIIAENTNNSLAKIGSVFTDRIVDRLVDSQLEVDNYYVCSVGSITTDDKKQAVSFGAFNHVFTVSKEKIKEKIGQKLKSVTGKGGR